MDTGLGLTSGVGHPHRPLVLNDDSQDPGIPKHTQVGSGLVLCSVPLEDEDPGGEHDRGDGEDGPRPTHDADTGTSC